MSVTETKKAILGTRLSNALPLIGLSVAVIVNAAWIGFLGYFVLRLVWGDGVPLLQSLALSSDLAAPKALRIKAPRQVPNIIPSSRPAAKVMRRPSD